MFGLGTPELVLILAVLLLLFGGKKIPELSKSLGEAIREIRKGLTDDLSDDSKEKVKKPKKAS